MFDNLNYISFCEIMVELTGKKSLILQNFVLCSTVQAPISGSLQTSGP